MVAVRWCLRWLPATTSGTPTTMLKRTSGQRAVVAQLQERLVVGVVAGRDRPAPGRSVGEPAQRRPPPVTAGFG
jgi:hypothetical protein